MAYFELNYFDWRYFNIWHLDWVLISMVLSMGYNGLVDLNNDNLGDLFDTRI